MFSVEKIEAGFLGRFSLSTTEEYSDNILFSEKKESDFITIATPTLSFAYKSPGQTFPRLTGSLSTSAEFFTQHSDLNNFGDNIRANIKYFYPYSRRLDFTLIDRLERYGQSRLSDFGGPIGGTNRGGALRGGSGGIGGLLGLGELAGLGGSESATCTRSGSVSQGRNSTSSFLNQGDLLSTGERLENQFGVTGDFRYSPNLTFRGGYCWESTAFLDEGGQETIHSVNLEASYLKSPQNRWYVRYMPSLIHSRDGQDNIVHDFDLGGDFMRLHQIHLTPTLMISASTGIAVMTGNEAGNGNGGNNKFRLENKLDANIVKIWEAALFTAGVRRGLTGSFGISGPSLTTSFFGQFMVNLTRRLSGGAGVEYSLFDTGGTKFDTLQAFIGLRYPITNGLMVGLGYSYNQLEPGSGAATNSVLPRGITSSNSVFVSLSMVFDIWPNLGLSREINGALTETRLPPRDSRPVYPSMH